MKAAFVLLVLVGLGAGGAYYYKNVANAESPTTFRTVEV
jgi:hypothetical protein